MTVQAPRAGIGGKKHMQNASLPGGHAHVPWRMHISAQKVPNIAPITAPISAAIPFEIGSSPVWKSEITRPIKAKTMAPIAKPAKRSNQRKVVA